MFELLFSEGSIGSLRLKNRLVLSCMNHNYAQDCQVTDRVVEFFRERARGGAGLITAGPYQLDQYLGMQGPWFLGLGEEAFLPDLRRITSAIHDEGAKAMAQLFHPGKNARSSIIGAQPISASPIVSNLTHEIPREVTLSEIKGIQRKFAEDVDRARRADFDAVEINACTGYLIREFLSPLTNQRTDQYGGSLENRMRFLLEIVRLARQEVGKEYPIICRISGDELLPGGNRLPEAKALALALEEAGVDAIHVTMGGHETTVPITPGIVPPGAYIHFAHEIKKLLKIPVIGGIRVNNPAQAESILAEGKVDFVAMARALLADPYLPKKAQEGKLEDIVPCVACQQGCLDRMFSDLPIACLVNPRAGYEGVREIRPAGVRKRVLVLGGGPAGMETALVAAQRGHRVTLWEKSSRLGGLLKYASLPPGKQEFLRLLSFFEVQLEKLGVRVELGREATAKDVLHEGPQVVVIATGTMPIIPRIPGVESPHVHLATEVFEGKALLGNRVVVVGGGAMGCETALFAAHKGAMETETALFLAAHGLLDFQTALELSRKGREVTIVEMLPRIGQDIGRTTLWSTLQNIKNAGIQVHTDAKAEEIVSDGVWVRRKEQRTFLPADSVILAVGLKPLDNLYHELEGEVPEVYLIGDAKKPRKALDAIEEGFLVACEI